MQLTTNGIVLRDYKIDENRVLTLLTDEHGVITAFANGANRTRSKLAASTELLCYSNLVLFRSRDRYSVDKADAHRIFFGIRSDLDKLGLASYLAELTMELAPREEEAGVYLKLLLNTLHLLEKEGRPPLQLKALYELRLLTLAGYMPNVVACRECGQYETEQMFFFPQHGELVCADCHTATTDYCRPISRGVLATLRHIVYSEGDKLFAFTLSDQGLRQLADISEDYLKYQVDKTFPTLEFYHSMAGFSAVPPCPKQEEST